MREGDISKTLKEISWAESAEILSKKFRWYRNHEILSITTCKNITLDIFEQISHLLRNEEEQNTILRGTVYTPYYLAKQIAEKLILQWLNTENKEKVKEIRFSQHPSSPRPLNLTLCAKQAFNTDSLVNPALWIWGTSPSSDTERHVPCHGLTVVYSFSLFFLITPRLRKSLMSSLYFPS